jgi:cyanophycinase
LNKLLIKISFIFIILNINLHSQGYLCAIGGGSEDYNSWSDTPYGWIVEKADSGKIIILSYSDATNWIPDYFMSLGATVAYNKKINSRDIADLQSTYDELITADAIFIKGGDQWNYVRTWKGTKTEEAIYQVFNSGGVIAGTSAGCAVLGDVDFSAKNGTVYPDEALLNPFTTYIQLEDNFLNLVPGVIFDSHLIERARNGRLIAMMFNYHYTGGMDVMGIGIDDRTAFCITPDLIGEVFGSGAVYIYQKDSCTIYGDYISGNYSIENLKSDQLTKGWKYDISNKEITYIPPSAKSVDTNRETLYPENDFWLTGNNSISNQLASGVQSFLSEFNSSSVLVISNPGYSNSLVTLTDYLDANSYIYSVLLLSELILSDPSIVAIMNNATCAIIAGDSLDVLSYLNQSGTLLSDAFYNKVINDNFPLYLVGDAGKIAGSYYIDNLEEDVYAAYRGKMTNNFGLNLFGDLIFHPRIFENSDYYENRMCSVLWGLMHNRNRFGIYLDGNASAQVNANEKSVSLAGLIPAIIIDATETSKVDSSTYDASSSVGHRQVVALNNLRYSLTTYDDVLYSFSDRKFIFTSGFNRDDIIQPNNTFLFQNYPNPFNSKTNISFQVPATSPVQINIYDVLGREIYTLINEIMTTGRYNLSYDASALPSGIYFYRLLTNNGSFIKKMILLK